MAATEIPSTIPNKCLLLISLALQQSPGNIPVSNVDHFVVNTTCIPSANITTPTNSTLFTLLVPQCTVDMNITIQPVDHCGPMRSATIKPQLLPKDDVLATTDPPHNHVQSEWKGG